MEAIQNFTRAIQQLTETALALLGLAVVAEILFGANVPFLQPSVLDNVISVVDKLGSQGVVGLAAIALLAWVLNRKNV